MIEFNYLQKKVEFRWKYTFESLILCLSLFPRFVSFGSGKICQNSHVDFYKFYEAMEKYKSEI